MDDAVLRDNPAFAIHVYDIHDGSVCLVHHGRAGWICPAKRRLALAKCAVPRFGDASMAGYLPRMGQGVVVLSRPLAAAGSSDEIDSCAWNGCELVMVLE